MKPIHLLWVLALALGLGGALAFFARRHESPPGAVDVSDVPEPVARRGASAGRRPVYEPVASPDAAELERRHWIAENNRATERMDAGELAAAIELLEACHAALPESDVFRRNLCEGLVRHARELYDEPRLERAVERLARALELCPGRHDAETLAGVVARWRVELALARDDTTDASDYFEVSYDASREDVLHRSGAVIAFLESVYGDLRDWFDEDPIVEGGRPRIRVVLYAPDEFHRLTGLGDWAGGAFDGVVRLSVADLEAEEGRWQRVARHELVHAFLLEVGGPSVPGWLNEGLAQWLELPAPHPGLPVARERLRGTKLFGLDELEGSLARWSDAGEITRAYAQSLVLVDHVAAQYGDEALRVMVRACAAQGDVAAAFEAATGVPLAFVARDLVNYLGER